MKSKILKFTKITFIVYLVITSFLTVKDVLKSSNGYYVDEVCILKTGDCDEEPNESPIKIVKGNEICRCVDWSIKSTPIEVKIKQNFGFGIILVSMIVSWFVYMVIKKDD